MIRKFQRQDLEAAVKIWLAANKEAHDVIGKVTKMRLKRCFCRRKSMFSRQKT